MKCSVCRAEIPNYSTVCPKCGDDPQANPYQAPSSATAAKAADNDADDPTEGMIPYKNPKALISYYLGIFSCIPFFGLLLAIPALALGILGLRDNNRNPAIKGRIHAGIGIGCGAFCMLLWGGAIIFLVIQWVSNASRF